MQLNALFFISLCNFEFSLFSLKWKVFHAAAALILFPFLFDNDFSHSFPPLFQLTRWWKVSWRIFLHSLLHFKALSLLTLIIMFEKIMFEPGCGLKRVSYKFSLSFTILFLQLRTQKEWLEGTQRRWKIMKFLFSFALSWRGGLVLLGMGMNERTDIFINSRDHLCLPYRLQIIEPKHKAPKNLSLSLSPSRSTFKHLFFVMQTRKTRKFFLFSSSTNRQER